MHSLPKLVIRYAARFSVFPLKSSEAPSLRNFYFSLKYSQTVKLQIESEVNEARILFFFFHFAGEEGEDNCDYVAVFLTSRKQGDLDVKYDFSVLKSDSTCWGRIGNTFKKFCPDQNSWGYGKAFSKAKLMEKQNELLPNGCLTIVCNLEIFYSDRTTQGKKRPKLDFSPVTEQPVKLGDQLSEAFSSGEFSDVTLVCGEKQFPCHKFILSARSDVFKAMFSHENTKEGQTNTVRTTDS